MKTKLFLVAAAFGSGIAMLGAQDAPKPPQPPGGGDPQARFEEAFKKMDANGDGKVSKEEFIEFSKKDAEERFGRMDASGSGSLSKEQIGEAMRRMRGGDGGQPRGEGGRPRPEGFRRPEGGDSGGVRQRPGADNQPGGNPPPPPPEGTGNPGGPGGPGERGMRGGMAGGSAMGEIFRKVGEGGVVTKEEYVKMSEEGFKRLDANGDGKITKEDLEELRKKMGDGRGGPPGAPGGAPQGEGGFRRRPQGDGAKPPGEGDKPRRPESN